MSTQLSNELFPDQISVYTIKYPLTPSTGISSLHTHLCKSFLLANSALLVDEIAAYLQDKPAGTVYSFFCRQEKKDITMVAWQLCCCRLNDSKIKLATGLVVFTYDLDLLDDIKKRLYTVLEHDNFFKENFEKAAKLTKKEKEIARLLTLGKRSKEIAGLSYTSVHTVNTHRRHINKKLGIQNLAALQQFAEVFDFTSHNNLL
jgi:LuxR family transcriptional regulator